MQQQAKHLPYLDGWRGMAIVFLLIGHFMPVPGIDLGMVGVDLFFALSGLLMTRILFVQKADLRTFYRRRIARILPSVAVFVLVVTAWHLLVNTRVYWSQVFAAVTFTNNYFIGAPGERTLPLGHIWSLSVEEHSYILLSLLAIISRKYLLRGTSLIGIASGAMALIAMAYWVAALRVDLPRLWMHSEIAAFGIFSSGLVCLFSRHLERIALPTFTVPVLVALGICAHWWSVPYPIRTIVGCGCFALAVNLLDRSSGIFMSSLEWAPLRKLGIWSFSVYIWQQLFYALPHPTLIDQLIGITASLSIGVAAYYVVEFPARSWINGEAGRRKSVPAVGAA